MLADYPYARGPPIGWRAALRREIDMKTKDSSYERFLKDDTTVTDVSQKLVKNVSDVPIVNMSTDSVCNVEKMDVDTMQKLPAEKKPCIDLTLEEDLSKLSLHVKPEENVVSNDVLNKLVPKPIVFVKNEPIDVEDQDSLITEMKNEDTARQYFDAKKSYKGRFYESTITENDILNSKTKKIVITTSTLRGVFDKQNDSKGLNVISAPGATVKALSKIVECELIACKTQPKVNVIITAGLNDFDRNHDLLTVKKDMIDLKKKIVDMLPNASCNFVRLPLPPTMCKLPENAFDIDRDRTLDILMFNNFLVSLNDICHDLSLEHMGIVDPKLTGYESWFTRDNVFYTGKKHDRSAWRKTEPLESAMHLDDSLRFRFWKENIENFFDFSC